MRAHNPSAFATPRDSSDARGSGARFFQTVGLLLTSIGALLALAVGSPASALAACPNEQLRTENNSTELPDCRAYEMVTPPFKDGYGVSAAAIAEDGSRVLGNSLGTFAGSVAMPASRASLGVIYELARGTAGWQVRPVTPANPEFRSAQTYDGASADLTHTLFSMPTAPVGQDDYWLRGPGASLTDIGPATPPADGPTVEPAPAAAGPGAREFQVVGGSADFSHVIFKIHGPYGWHGDPSREFNLYEYVGSGNSEPAMVGVTGGIGSTQLIGQCGTLLGAIRSNFNSVSADGKTIFFTPSGEDTYACGQTEPPVAELYARLGGSETIKLSAPSAADCHSPCGTAAPSDARFAGAARDGSKAFFLSTEQLTDQAGEDARPGDTAEQEAGSGCQQAHGSGCNLYEYDFDNPNGSNLIAVSAGSSSPHVQGVVRISQDGSHVYFVAQGKLTGETNAEGEEAVEGANNLYVFERDSAIPGGRTRFIATLAPSHGPEGETESSDEGLWGGVLDSDIERPAQATPDGAYLAFQSHADLTPDDTSTGVWQVFEYEAETGALRRISVGDEGFNDDGNTDEYPASISAPGYSLGLPEPPYLALSNDGSYVFFSSANALAQGMSIPAPGAGSENAYVYHDGRVHLIYGAGSSRVSLYGGSASGADAFFQTIDRLVPSDTDTQKDIYDARIDGGFPIPVPLPSCAGDACQGTAAPPPPAPPAATSTFSGPGNATESAKCRKGFAKARGGHCLKRHKKAHKRKTHSRSRDANTNRRAGK